jgi:phosphatidylinositol alpha-mannosyltransferase
MKHSRPLSSPSSLKIGLVLDTSLDPPDGVQQYVIGIGEWLRAQGHDVHYLVGETTSRQLPNIHSLTRNISVSFNGNKTTIPLWLSHSKARRFMNDQQFDILHVQTPHHPFMSQRLILAAPATTGVLATFHILPYGRLERLATKLLGWLLRPSLKRIDAMLAVSTAAATFEIASFGRPVTVLPNVIDYDRFHRARAFDKQLPTVLFLGRLVPRKGCQTLLEAVALLQVDPTLPPFRTLICGKGALRSSLETYVSENHLSNVEFTGFVDEADKPRYYATADISVFPSISGESFGIVLLEAMAAGSAAVLAGDNPGYRTVMEPQPDQLFEPANPAILADKIRVFLQDDSKRRAAAAWGQTYAADFDVETVGQQLVKRYNKVLRSRANLR